MQDRHANVMKHSLSIKEGGEIEYDEEIQFEGGEE
jgi:hypothetical protein